MLLHEVFDIVIQRRSGDVQCEVLGGNFVLFKGCEKVTNLASVTGWGSVSMDRVSLQPPFIEGGQIAGQ